MRGLTDSLLLVEVTIAVWGRVGLVCAEVSLSPLMLGEAENLPISHWAGDSRVNQLRGQIVELNRA